MRKIVLLLLSILYSICSFTQNDVVGIWKLQKVELSFLNATNREIVSVKADAGSILGIEKMIMQLTPDRKLILDKDGYKSEGIYWVADGYLMDNILFEGIMYMVSSNSLILYYDVIEGQEGFDNLKKEYPNIDFVKARINVYHTKLPDNYYDYNYNKQVECDPSEKPYITVEQMPQFVGGNDAMIKFIKAEMIYPEEALKNGVYGRVTLRFTVQCDGVITDIEIIRGIDPFLDKEAVRIVELMPNWVPGKQNGRNVPVRFMLPIAFRLPD